MRTIEYRGWQIFLRDEWQGISADFGRGDDQHRGPFCFASYDQAEEYARGCIDQLMRLEAPESSPTQASLLV